MGTAPGSDLRFHVEPAARRLIEETWEELDAGRRVRSMSSRN
jgi:hypothetical protein